VARRASLGDEWGTPVNLGPKVNTDNWETTPCLSQDGLTLYFTSGRHNEFMAGGRDGPLRSSSRDQRGVLGTVGEYGTGDNDYSFDCDPAISPDGLMLLFSSDRGVHQTTRTTQSRLGLISG